MEYLLDKASDNPERVVLRMGPEAVKVWLDFYNWVETRIGVDGYLADIKDFASKTANILSRIAAVVHYFNEKEGDIDFESATFARDACIILIDSFKDLLGNGSEGQMNRLRAYEIHKYLYKKFMTDRLLLGVTKKELNQLGPNGCRTAAKIDQTLNLLEIQGIVSLTISQNGKSPLVKLNHYGFTYIEPCEPTHQFDRRWVDLLRV